MHVMQQRHGPPADLHGPFKYNFFSPIKKLREYASQAAQLSRMFAPAEAGLKEAGIKAAGRRKTPRFTIVPSALYTPPVINSVCTLVTLPFASLGTLGHEPL